MHTLTNIFDAGFLPKGLYKYQQDHYIHLGSRRKGKTWAKQLCEKLIQATHSLWLKRNLFEHNRTSHGLKKIEDVREQAVEWQYAIGISGLKQSDHFLFQKSKVELWVQSGEYIRSWLATVLLARGEFESAKQDILNNRGEKRGFRKQTGVLEVGLHQMKRRK